MGVLGVERIRGEYIAYLVLITKFLCCFSCTTAQVEVRNRSIGTWQFVLRCIVAVGASAHGDDQVAHIQVFVNATCATHADNRLHIVEVIQLIRVDTYRWNTHAVSHHAHAFAVVRTRKTEHAAYIIKLHWILQVFLCHHLCAQWITCHDDGLGDFA